MLQWELRRVKIVCSVSLVFGVFGGSLRFMMVLVDGKNLDFIMGI